MLCDTMGLEEQSGAGLDIEDISSILQGHVPDRYKVRVLISRMNEGWSRNDVCFMVNPLDLVQPHSTVSTRWAKDVQTCISTGEDPLCGVRDRRHQNLPHVWQTTGKTCFHTQKSELTGWVNIFVTLDHKTSHIQNHWNWDLYIIWISFLLMYGLLG